MSEILGNCPRCPGTHVTFDIYHGQLVGIDFQWRRAFEAYGVCRACHQGCVLVLQQTEHKHDSYFRQYHDEIMSLPVLAGALECIRHVRIAGKAASPPPEYLPDSVDRAFREGSQSLSSGCFNAAGAMFRLSLDLATKDLTPLEADGGPVGKVRRDLGLRLQWLFQNERLPKDLADLSTCIKDDGNDGVHDGNLGVVEAEDLFDFSFTLLERLYTDPERVRLATERRAERRSNR